MFYIGLGIATIAFIIFWIVNRIHYAIRIDCFSAPSVQIYNTLHRTSFNLFPNFSNYTWVLFRKLLLFFIFAALIHFANWEFMPYVFSVFEALDLFSLFTRIAEFKEIKQNDNTGIYTECFAPIYGASKRIPVYTFILHALLFLI